MKGSWACVLLSKKGGWPAVKEQRTGQQTKPQLGQAVNAPLQSPRLQQIGELRGLW